MGIYIISLYFCKLQVMGLTSFHFVPLLPLNFVFVFCFFGFFFFSLAHFCFLCFVLFLMFFFLMGGGFPSPFALSHCFSHRKGILPVLPKPLLGPIQGFNHVGPSCLGRLPQKKCCCVNQQNADVACFEGWCR